jgi:hypothetical protein
VDYFFLLVFKFKLYAVAMIAAILAGGVRAASKKRLGQAPTIKDTFCYIIMTMVITGMCAGGIIYMKLPVNNETLFGYGFCFVFIGQFTDFIYLRAGTMLEGFLDKYGSKKK